MPIVYRLQGIEFEWNADKAESNIRKHDVAFREAAEVFFDPFHQTGDAFVDDEDREFILGYSLSERLLLVVYVERGERTRIISARRATQHEKILYENV